MDASNMLKPMLARGELHTIGATTLDEYRKYIEKDAALERRFQPVMVGEPTVEDTISILRGLRERYEIHHGVKFKDAALVAAAVLSNRYIADRFLPDKAIDLVDEAASKLRMEIDSMPAELDEVERRIMQLEIEREALRKETRQGVEGAARQAREGARRPQGGAQPRSPAHWQQEKDAIQRSRKLKEELEQALRGEIERAQRAGDYAKASELQYGRVPELERQIQDAGSAAGRAAEEPADAEGRSRRGGHRRGRQQVDGHPGQPADGRRGPEADPHGGAAAPARRRPGRGDRRGRRTPSAAPAPACRIRTGRSAASSSSARPASARPSWRARSPSSCSTTSRRWSASTCRSTRRSTPSRG